MRLHLLELLARRRLRLLLLLLLLILRGLLRLRVTLLLLFLLLLRLLLRRLVLLRLTLLRLILLVLLLLVLLLLLPAGLVGGLLLFAGELPGLLRRILALLLHLLHLLEGLFDLPPRHAGVLEVARCIHIFGASAHDVAEGRLRPLQRGKRRLRVLLHLLLRLFEQQSADVVMRGVGQRRRTLSRRFDLPEQVHRFVGFAEAG